MPSLSTTSSRLSADQRDVLDAFAVELHQEFFDLAAALLGLFVQRDADLAVGRGHGLGRQAGVFALDVEVADLAEVEQLLVEVGPEAHATAVHVVREVVDFIRPWPTGRRSTPSMNSKSMS